MAGSPNPLGTVRVDLGELRAPLEVHAAENGYTLSEYMRWALRQAMQHEPPVNLTLKRGVTEVPRQAFNLFLTPSELEGVKTRAAQAGLSGVRWLQWLIRANLTRVPHFGQKELEGLTLSNLLLLKLNRRVLSASHGDASGVAELSLEIQRHTQLVAELIRANQMRWLISSNPDE